MPAEKHPVHPILLVDDEEDLVHSLESLLHLRGYTNTIACSDSREAEAIFTSQRLSVMLLDISMPHTTGEELLPKAVAADPALPIIMFTAYSDAERIVRCMKAGAFDYMVKPIEKQRFLTAIAQAIEIRGLRDENAHLQSRLRGEELRNPEAFASMVTSDERMIAAFRYVEAVASTSQPVFVTGETGVGKELVAQAIHAVSGRKGRFVPINVAGLDDTMFSDTFFGHVRGAYTSASGSREGLIEQATGGTLFLDEIGDLTMASQVKLLRLLQEREYLPLGADRPKTTDARIVAATNRDVRKRVLEGAFREDLYFRLVTHQVRIPPLRERIGDLPALLSHFLRQAAVALRREPPTPPRELVTYLTAYDFPGNIREFEAMVFNAVANHQSGVLSMSSFVRHMNESRLSEGDDSPSAPNRTDALSFPDALPTLRETTLLLVQEALRRAEQNQTAAAQMLGVSRQTMNKYAKDLPASDA
ncbi:MAG: sigma-54-dependent Fis family transcriptional regulator [Lentisphaerae bacterium]|jgi:DNA-binding NtrC family response regulator|nr:sigma-54-dependent Fis family transcriptional regulator [Lentisphaerota bacterium]MBT4822791.1 sigma-54-dependent Fis family transcriptional regulator [Lentisphaerota bacterium]MBT5609625.1 sigma-54-dependent Fis family transcriptional regulator [Lentisphaerota bacterium]MBT7060865.1 sigma-54-dependent Fis family transcriptional regulator [Lentisphaerota bacterium]MBT7842540.1 sigma-54-dependent Fis family transcriptional regulator [Lentisphaerota bacterium]